MSKRAPVDINDFPPAMREQLRGQMEAQNKTKWSNARKVEADGEVYRSKAEYIRWKELKAMEEAGEIFNLRHECIRFYLGRDDNKRPMTFLPDFTYHEYLWDEKRLTIDETKGRRGRDFGVRLALFRQLYPDWRVLVNGKEVE